METLKQLHEVVTTYLHKHINDTFSWMENVFELESVYTSERTILEFYDIVI